MLEFSFIVKFSGLFASRLSSHFSFGSSFFSEP